MFVSLTRCYHFHPLVTGMVILPDSSQGCPKKSAARIMTLQECYKSSSSNNNYCYHNCVKESLDNEQIVIIDFYRHNDQLDNVLKEAKLPGNILWSTTFNSAYFTLSILRNLDLFIPAPRKVLHAFSRAFGGHKHAVKIDPILAFSPPPSRKTIIRHLPC